MVTNGFNHWQAIEDFKPNHKLNTHSVMLEANKELKNPVQEKN